MIQTCGSLTTDKSQMKTKHLIVCVSIALANSLLRIFVVVEGKILFIFEQYFRKQQKTGTKLMEMDRIDIVVWQDREVKFDIFDVSVEFQI